MKVSPRGLILIGIGVLVIVLSIIGSRWAQQGVATEGFQVSPTGDLPADGTCVDVFKVSKIIVRPSVGNELYKVTDDYWLGISQLQVFDENGVNVAPQGTATATSNYNAGGEVSAPASKAIDGLVSDAQSAIKDLWHVGKRELGQTWTLQLRAPTQVSKVVFVGRNVAGYDHRNIGVRIELYDAQDKLLHARITTQSPKQEFIIRASDLCKSKLSKFSIPCPFIADAAFVRILPVPNRSNIISHIAVLDWERTNVALDRPVLSVLNGVETTIVNNLYTKVANAPFDWLDESDKVWRSTSPGDSLTVDLGGPKRISRIVFFGTTMRSNITNQPTTGIYFSLITIPSSFVPPYYSAGEPLATMTNYQGTRIQLLDADREVISEFRTQGDGNVQVVEFCTNAADIITVPNPNTTPAAPPARREAVPIVKTIVPIPAGGPPCQAKVFGSGGASQQWLCPTLNEARRLLEGPPGIPNQTYLRTGDVVCYAQDPNQTRYACFAPYSPERPFGAAVADTTPTELLQTSDELCTILSKNTKELMGNLDAIGKLSDTAETNIERIQRAEQDLGTLYTSMKCSDRMPIGRQRNICAAIRTGQAKLRNEREKVQTLKTGVDAPATAVSSSRATLSTLARQFSCIGV